MNYQILSKSEYLGAKNAADILYETNDIKLGLKTVELIVIEIIKLIKYHLDNLLEQELVIGLDTGLYNFMIRDRSAYYVDFYPPRLRLDAFGKRLDDACIITDYPQPRNVKHGEHLTKYFYTRNGLLIHCLAHIWAALDSNELLCHDWQTAQRSALDLVFKLLANASLHNTIRHLKADFSLSNSQFKKLRGRFYQHRTRYLSKSPLGGYNLCERQIKHNIIRKFYLADKQQGIGFSERAGHQMLQDCRRYYLAIEKIGINVPHTKFKLLYLN